MKRLLAAAALLSALATAAPAHEFWIEPVAARVAVGEPIVARTLIGSDYVGDELASYAELRVALDVTLDGVTVPITVPDVQKPAIRTPGLGEGLHVLRYQSRDHQLTYAGYDKFLLFLAEAQRQDLEALYAPGGLPRDGIREVYFRYAKALVAVGSGAGADSFLGMPWELVALDNPYTAAPGSALRFALRFRGEPAPDAAVHVFIRAPDGTVANQRLRTDAAGVVTVAYAGPGHYMVNAINILPASKRMQALLGATWQSLWASSTHERD